MFSVLFNAINLTVKIYSTTSEAQPPPDDAPFIPIFDYATLRRRRRGVPDVPNSAPLGLRRSPPQEFEREVKDSADAGVQGD